MTLPTPPFHKLLLAFVLLIGCRGMEQQPDDAGHYLCQTAAPYRHLSRHQLLQSFSPSLLQGLASVDVPDSEGAMGRNRKAYFHVRFQVGIWAQSDYAVASQDARALESAIQALEYSFQRQLAGGDFELVVPPELSGQTPGRADLASGVSFFLASVGIALHNFEQSSWYHSAAMAPYKSRVEILRSPINRAADWLLAQAEVLERADQNAPNRLFFNALALYSLGNWLGDETLQSAGIRFARLGISKRHPSGYFLEGNGWDSSYQGVALHVGFGLYSLLPADADLKTELWNCLSCAADWQKSRILETGEISTQGNVRVYAGGEQFLGREKQVDWIKTMTALFSMGYYTQQPVFMITAGQIRDFYHRSS